MSHLCWTGCLGTSEWIQYHPPTMYRLSADSGWPTCLETWTLERHRKQAMGAKKIEGAAAEATAPTGKHS